FPEGFLWGVASAAAQVETREGRSRSNWDVFADQKGHILDGSTNAVNTAFETHYAEDFAMLATAGVNAFRFSFAWPRLQPDGPGKPNEAGLALYDRIIDEMLRRGMTPAATMFHWDMPLWAGDLRDRDIAQRLADYADILTRRFGDRVGVWLALNEPNTVAAAGYAFGIHAPGLASVEAVGAAVHHQNLAQGMMIAAARANLSKDARISTTINIQSARPMTDSPEDAQAARMADAFWNGAWLDPLFGRDYPQEVRPLVEPFVKSGDMEVIAARPDCIGVNYYSRVYAQAQAGSPIGFMPQLDNFPEKFIRTQMLPVEPDGLTEVLMRIHTEYGAPDIYVTETGFALDDPQPVDGVVHDPKRSTYLKSYLQAAHQAVDQGAKLRGIFYWAGTDNWEWAMGFSKTFGLIQVDRATQKRTPKSSLGYYAQCIKINGVA
ncbi:glycoside hydrolase family 1 protein, partial [Castellaniella sp.]|uniref:glycoside hydrolase family 1 protein n=1 Tax=Castellaniella sp. TaxID=1955812 RepID=UPI00355E9BF6